MIAHRGAFSVLSEDALTGQIRPSASALVAEACHHTVEAHHYIVVLALSLLFFFLLAHGRAFVARIPHLHHPELTRTALIHK